MSFSAPLRRVNAAGFAPRMGKTTTYVGRGNRGGKTKGRRCVRFARVSTARAALLTSGRAVVLRHARTPAADNNKGLNNSFGERLRAGKTR